MEKTAGGSTVRLYRVLRAPADRVYRAFIEPPAMCKWFPPDGYVAEIQRSEVRVGGEYHMSFTNFRTGQAHSFGGKYLEISPNQRIRYTDKFDDPNLQGEIQVSITFREVSCGTELTILQENLPSAIPVELCYLGWQESLSALARLVEPEIP